jgi:hypothetical protein
LSATTAGTGTHKSSHFCFPFVRSTLPFLPSGLENAIGNNSRTTSLA